MLTLSEVTLKTRGAAIPAGVSEEVDERVGALRLQPTAVHTLYSRLYVVYGARPDTVSSKPMPEVSWWKKIKSQKITKTFQDPLIR